MRTRNILLASLLAALYGCQQDTSNKPAAWILADKTGCFMCHTTGKNLLGPAWESVAERYKSNPDAEAHLINKIKNGGSGAWIDKDMPAFADELINEESRKILANYIMSLR